MSEGRASEMSSVSLVPDYFCCFKNVLRVKFFELSLNIGEDLCLAIANKIKQTTPSNLFYYRFLTIKLGLVRMIA